MLLGLYYFEVPRMAKEKTERAALSSMLAKFQNDHRQEILETKNTDVSVCALIFNAIDRGTQEENGVWRHFSDRGKITVEVFTSVIVEMHAMLQLKYDETALKTDAANVFSHFDVDKNGELAEKEFAVLTCALVEAWQEDLNDAQIDALIHHKWGNQAAESAPWFAEILPSKPVSSRQKLLRHCAYLQKEQILSVGKTYWNESEHAPENERMAIDCVGFLFLSYRVEYWFFELWEQVRKLLMTSVIVVFYPGSLVQLTGGIFITFIGLVACFVMKPYLQQQLNDLQAACLSIQGVTLFYGVILVAENTSTARSASTTIITQLILAVNILAAFIPLVQFFILRPPPFGQRPLWERLLNTVWVPKERESESSRRRSSAIRAPVDFAFYDRETTLTGLA